MSKFIAETFVLFSDFAQFFFKSLIKRFEMTNAKLVIVLDLYIIGTNGRRRWEDGRSVMGVSSP